MNGKIIGAVVVVIIVVAGGWYYVIRPAMSVTLGPLMPPTSGNAGKNPIVDTMPVQQTIKVVTYTDQGYSPAEVTIPAGGVIMWQNESSGSMWVATAMHPSHVVYDGTTKNEHCVNDAPTSNTVFDECVGHPMGSSWSFTFTKPGTWKYHDHITSGKYGSVIVTEALVDTGDSNAVSI